MYSVKVVVYAICKNEAQFVDRWVDSMSEADEIYVLDTGSSDCTLEKLKARGVHTQSLIINPWRFDVARNRSLQLVPSDADICVCTDLDEVFHRGWRAALERAWNIDTTRARYRYTWSFNSDGSEGVVFYSDKIHARFGFEWVNPVHEVLRRTSESHNEKTVIANGVQLDHHPDNTKSRGQYLPLLELAVKERPNDDRNMHYLGREYMFNARWDDCISTLLRHLTMPTALWRDERAASMRYIAKAYAAKNNTDEAMRWHLRAIAEAPHLREPYTDAAAFLYALGDWEGVAYFTNCALKIKERPTTYICEAAAWGSLPYDLRAVALHNTGRLHESLQCAETALALEPQNSRLVENVNIIKSKL